MQRTTVSVFEGDKLYIVILETQEVGVWVTATRNKHGRMRRAHVRLLTAGTYIQQKILNRALEQQNQLTLFSIPVIK